jgi:hypothetical protein
MINYLKEKRKEDIKQALRLISENFRLETLGISGKSLFKTLWFLIEVPDQYSTEQQDAFVLKVKNYFGKLLKKTRSECFFLVFVDGKKAKEKIRSLISAILIVSPKGRIVAFFSVKDLFKDYLKSDDNDSLNIGMTKVFLFNDLINTLTNEKQKAKLFLIIKNYENI